MIRALERSVRSAVLGEVRDELRERSPRDGYRPYDAVRLSEDVRAAFDEVAAGKGPDAVIDTNAVVDVYALNLARTLSDVNRKGPKWLTPAEAESVPAGQMRGRVVSLRAEIARGQQNLSMEAVERRATRFVADHSAPIGVSGNAIDVFFPAFDTGNGADWGNRVPGVDARLVTDAKDALRLLKMFETDASPAELERLHTFDPRREILIVVRDSDDESKWYPAAIDKKSGKPRGFDSYHNEVKFTDVATKADFEKIFGRGSAAGIADDDLASAFYERLEALFGRGQSLPIAELDPPGLDKPALTKAAAASVEKYLGALRELPPELDLDDTYRTTLEAIRTAVAGGQHIQVGEQFGDPILLMPRKFAGAPTEDYMVGWAFSELTKQVPSLSRFYNVDAKAA